MNTQIAAVCHQSSSPGTGYMRMAALILHSACGSFMQIVVRGYTKQTVFLQFITRFPGNYNNSKRDCTLDLHYLFDRFMLLSFLTLDIWISLLFLFLT